MKHSFFIALLSACSLSAMAQEQAFPEAEVTHQHADKIYFDNQITTVFYQNDVVYAANREGYDPKLDDGVGKNIAPLQKRKMLSYEVLNAGQLMKYLNADL